MFTTSLYYLRFCVTDFLFYLLIVEKRELYVTPTFKEAKTSTGVLFKLEEKKPDVSTENVELFLFNYSSTL
jgi:hypothetical protein